MYEENDGPALLSTGHLSLLLSLVCKTVSSLCVYVCTGKLYGKVSSTIHTETSCDQAHPSPVQVSTCLETTEAEDTKAHNSSGYPYRYREMASAMRGSQ